MNTATLPVALASTPSRKLWEGGMGFTIKLAQAAHAPMEQTKLTNSSDDLIPSEKVIVVSLRLIFGVRGTATREGHPRLI